MKQNKVKTYILNIMLAELTGAIAGFLTKEGTKAFKYMAKPKLTPPAAIFPIAWSILYLLMGIGISRIELLTQNTQKAQTVYMIQLGMNFLWSIFFFNMQAYGFAFLWLVILLALIIVMVVLFYSKDKTAAILQLPYLFWVAFAGYLNYGVWMLNK